MKFKFLIKQIIQPVEATANTEEEAKEQILQNLKTQYPKELFELVTIEER